MITASENRKHIESNAKRNQPAKRS